MTGPAETSIREVAEYPNSFIPLGLEDERVQTDRYTLCLSIGATVQRQRFGQGEVDEVLAEVRELLRARGRTSTQWEVGSESSELVGPLLGRGLVRDADPVGLAMALEREPPEAPDGLAVRVAETLEEYLDAVAVQAAAFGASPEEAARHREGMRRRWAGTPFVIHTVWWKGALVGAGACAVTPVGLALFGGGVLREARGRGAYRALIAERWRHAVSIGRPVLVAQAGSMSRPILEGLGFRAVGRVAMLRDELVDEAIPGERPV